MSPDLAFYVSLGATVLVLVGVVITGHKARRRAHLTLVAIVVVLLVVTIWFAEQLGEHYDLEAAGTITTVHLTLAKVTTVAYLLPVITGVRTLRNPERRRLHRNVAFSVIALTLVTFATGIWMISAAERLS